MGLEHPWILISSVGSRTNSPQIPREATSCLCLHRLAWLTNLNWVWFYLSFLHYVSLGQHAQGCSSLKDRKVTGQATLPAHFPACVPFTVLSLMMPVHQSREMKLCCFCHEKGENICFLLKIIVAFRLTQAGSEYSRLHHSIIYTLHIFPLSKSIPCELPCFQFRRSSLPTSPKLLWGQSELS